jgi:hypothetical protein
MYCTVVKTLIVRLWISNTRQVLRFCMWNLSKSGYILYEERLRGTAQKGCFCVRNGSATPTEEGFAKQTQVILLGRWCAEDVA